jgi:hypothetical protein
MRTHLLTGIIVCAIGCSDYSASEPTGPASYYGGGGGEPGSGS